jgi:hypothetical protein
MTNKTLNFITNTVKILQSQTPKESRNDLIQKNTDKNEWSLMKSSIIYCYL